MIGVSGAGGVDRRATESGCVEPVRRDVVVDGLHVAVYETGTGEPCVLLHGYPQDHRCWRHVVGPLAYTHRVIAVDWFGWGQSERPLHTSLRYEEEVVRLSRLLDALELRETNLFGHDYGAFIALGFALRSPERLLRLAILNSRAQSTFPWLPYLEFGALSRMASNPFLRPFFNLLPLYEIHARSLRRYVRNGSFSTDELDAYIGWMRTTDGKQWLAHFYRHYSVALRPDLAEGAERLNIPAAVIWGDADPFCPFLIAEQLEVRLPRASLTRIAGADHYVIEERPVEVQAALRELLERRP